MGFCWLLSVCERERACGQQETWRWDMQRTKFPEGGRGREGIGGAPRERGSTVGTFSSEELHILQYMPTACYPPIFRCQRMMGVQAEGRIGKST